MLINNNKNHIPQYQTQCSDTEDVQIFSEGRKHKLEDTSFSQYSVHILFSNYTDKDVSICSEPKEK